jgi:phosphoglycerate kinase
MNLKSLRSLTKNDLAGKTVLVRVDWNVPIKNNKVVDGFRIIESLKTLEYLAKYNCQIKIATHLADPLQTTACLESFLKNHLAYNKIEILPNLRSNPGEEKNSAAFAKSLSRGADFFVNEAFSVCHREHASVVRLPKLLPAYAGFRLEEEVKELSSALNPKHPFLFILGGAKFGTKLPLIKKYLNLADYVFVGGALANSLMKASGLNVGESLVDTEKMNLKPIAKNLRLILPSDVLVKSSKGVKNKKATEVGDREVIVDIGKQSPDQLQEIIRTAKLIVWNGPLGFYEKGFTEGTGKMAKLVAASRAKTIIGGGDTLAVVNALGLNRSFSFISTGGGAMLRFLTDGTLPGLESLKID